MQEISVTFSDCWALLYSTVCIRAVGRVMAPETNCSKLWYRFSETPI